MINSSKTQSIWQIGLFACNNAATNCYMILLNMVSYYTFGPAGMLMSVLLNVATVMRIFDGFTDPFIGTLIDKTQTRFGKYRPFMIIGQLIMLGSVLILFTLVNKIPNTFLAYLVFTLVYAVYILASASLLPPSHENYSELILSYAMGGNVEQSSSFS